MEIMEYIWEKVETILHNLRLGDKLSLIYK